MVSIPEFFLYSGCAAQIEFNCLKFLISLIEMLLYPVKYSKEYKSIDQLPEGGVLVVGAGQSGAQIAEELLENGKETWLAVSKCGRRPRNYRSKDSSWWNYEMGSFDKTVDDVPFEQRWGCSPHTSGSRGGHDINLITLAEQGLKLCGTVKNCNSNKIVFNDNLHQNLIFSDPFLINFEVVMLQNPSKIIEILIKSMQTLNLKHPNANDL